MLLTQFRQSAQNIKLYLGNNSNLISSLIWLLIFLIVSIFFYAVFTFSYNFPFYDDFENILLFAENFSKSNSAEERFVLLFKQNFDHRVLFARLLTISMYLVTGEINIDGLIVLGDLTLIGTALIFYQYHAAKKMSLLVFFSSICLLFQVQHYEDSISWATCALQHAPVIFLSLLSFHLALNRKNLYLSGLVAVFSLFTSANGLCSIVLWLVIAAVQTNSLKKILLPGAVVTLITVVHLFTLKVHSGSIIQHMTSDVCTKFSLLLSFAGLIADVNILDNITPSIVLGTLFLLPLPIIVIKIIAGKSSEITTLQWLCATGIMMLLFTGFLIIFARGDNSDFLGYRMDRYKIYAAYFPLLAIGFFDEYWSIPGMRKPVCILITMLSFFFCIGTYYVYYGKIMHYQQVIASDQINSSWSNTIYNPLIFKNISPKCLFTFQPANHFLQQKSSLEILLNDINWRSIKRRVAVQRYEDQHKIVLRNNSFGIGYSPGYDELYIIAVDQAQDLPKYVFVVDKDYKNSIKQFYTCFKRPIKEGFAHTIFKHKLQNGKYNLSVVAVRKHQIVNVSRIGEMEVR